MCTPVCGDGLIRGTEQCDDRNLDPDDGCSASCGSEPGWNCGGEPTACTCGVAASVSPPSSLRLPQTIRVDAEASFSGCGLPLQYFWDCISTTNSGCGGFMAAANANGNTTSSAEFTLYDSDSVTFTVNICLAGTSTCTEVVRQYTVASL